MKQFRNRGSFKMLQIANQKFNKLTALFPSKFEHGSYYWRCLCDCGNETDVIASKIVNGKIKSCGCARAGVNKKHGLKSHSLYSKWNNMKQRCYNPNNCSYPNYGAIGITVCDRWLNSVEDFYNDVIDGWELGLHLDRIDNSKGYSPENCRWVSMKENQNNKKTNVWVTHDGRTHTLAKWAEELGVKDNTLSSRKRKGYTDYEVLFGLK